MPAQRPGRSVQEVGTPRAFLGAVQERFGAIAWDLAANEANHVVAGWFGPGSPTQDEDALGRSWQHAPGGLLWLNPPYNRIKDFAVKCKLEAVKGARIAMLIPASVATNWFADHIHGNALVLPIRPRLTFVGHSAPYPKDLMLVLWDMDEPDGFEPWEWNK
jgi:phage N-6-adenine-methyltransferase